MTDPAEPIRQAAAALANQAAGMPIGGADCRMLAGELRKVAERMPKLVSACREILTNPECTICQESAEDPDHEFGKACPDYLDDCRAITRVAMKARTALAACGVEV